MLIHHIKDNCRFVLCDRWIPVRGLAYAGTLFAIRPEANGTFIGLLPFWMIA